MPVLSEVADLIDVFMVPCSLQRRTTTVNEFHEDVRGYSASEPIVAAVVPFNSLIRGRGAVDHNQELVDVYTRESLSPSDLITYEGRDYEVDRIRNYSPIGGASIYVGSLVQ